MVKSFDLHSYFGNTSNLNKLANHICQPVFLKTKIDVLYDDILNWERNDLLSIEFGIKPEDTSYKKTAISFIEYVWIKTVETLRRYGFSYDDIKEIKTRMSEKLYLEVIYNNLIKGDEVIKGKYDPNLHKKAEKLSKKKSHSYITFFEQIVFDTINNKTELKILFSRNEPKDFFLLTKDIVKLLEENKLDNVTQHVFQCDHFSFSFYKIFEHFLNFNKNSFDGAKISILSEEEEKIMRILRGQYHQLKSITIRFNKSKPTHLEIKSTKKVAAQSRIMDHIKKKDYSTIVIQTADGNVVNFENTRKYKL
jgi:hypothetical protein